MKQEIDDNTIERNDYLYNYFIEKFHALSEIMEKMQADLANLSLPETTTDKSQKDLNSLSLLEQEVGEDHDDQANPMKQLITWLNNLVSEISPQDKGAVNQPDELFTYVAGNCVIPASTSLCEALDEFKKNYPQNEQWRLLVDGILYASLPTPIEKKLPQENGLEQYEAREPGCLSAFLSAWYYCLYKLEKSETRQLLHIDFIKELHKRVTKGTKLQPSQISSINQPSNFRIHGEYFCFTGGASMENYKYSEAGVEDLFQAMIEKKLPGSSLSYRTDEKFATLTLQSDQNRRIEFLIQKSDESINIHSKRNFFREEEDNIFKMPIHFNLDESLGEKARLKIANENRSSLYCILVDNTIWYGEQLTSSNISEKLSSNLHLAKEVFNKIQNDFVRYDAVEHQFLDEKINDILKNYNESIGDKKTDDGKLKLIAKTIEALERVHPFPDGNGRTFVNLLLNYLLLMEGFPPATLFEPNVFDVFSDHLLNVLKRGIYHTLTIYEGQKKLFGFELSSSLRLKLQELTKIASLMYVEEEIAKIVWNSIFNFTNWTPYLFTDSKKYSLEELTNNLLNNPETTALWKEDKNLYDTKSIQYCLLSSIQDCLFELSKKVKDTSLKEKLVNLSSTIDGKSYIGIPALL